MLLLTFTHWQGYMTSSLRDLSRFGNRVCLTPLQTAHVLSSKIDGVESSLSHGGARAAYFSGASSKKKEESPLSKISKDSTKITLEQIQGLMSQVIKNSLFNGEFGSADHMEK